MIDVDGYEGEILELTIKFLKANNGDSIFITYKGRNILIDGGSPRTYSQKKGARKIIDGELKNLVDSLGNDEKIDLLIITHWDDDHIGGILKWFEEDSDASSKIGNIWFNGGELINQYFDKSLSYDNSIPLKIYNSYNTSNKQAITFEEIISDNEIWNKRLLKFGDEVEFGDIKFTILSPTHTKLLKLLEPWKRERYNPNTSTITDYSLSIDELALNPFKEDMRSHNGSSIAFILKLGTKDFLFLGDAHPSTICDSLDSLGYSKENPLDIEFVKVSHHASRANTSEELLDMLDCDKFIITADGSHHGLPHKEALAKIITKKNGCTLYFNYPHLIPKIFLDDELNKDNRFEAKSTEEIVL